MRSNEMREAAMGDPLLTLKQAAKILNVSLRTMCSLRSRGVIPVVQISPRTIRIRRKDLDAYIEENLQAPRHRRKKRRS